MSLFALTVAPISVVQLKHNNSFGVDKLVYPGVCDTPLHVCKKAHAFLSYYNVRTGTI